MKILILSQWFDPETCFKGALFARQLIARGHQVEVLTGFPNYPGGKLYPGFRFKPENTTVLIDTKDQVYAEYLTHTRAAATGRLIHHLFTGYLVAEGGKIKLLREALNTVAGAQALYPNGVADLTPPEAEIFSVPPGYES